MKLVQSYTKHRDEKQGYSKKILINDPWSFVQEIKIKPGEMAQSHYHKVQTEVFYFLNDNGYRVVNGKKITPKKWDVLVIEPNDKHTIINNTDQEYLYLAYKVNYNPDDSYRE
jgi:quercetin dioxygenase-like cupin family protein